MKYSFIPALIFIIMLSCNKEITAPAPQPTIDLMPQFAVSAKTFEVSSKLLKREISYTKNNPFLKNVRMFTYDNSKRCTEIKIGTIDSSITNPVFNLKQTLTFTYDGSVLLPSSFSSVKTVFPLFTMRLPFCQRGRRSVFARTRTSEEALR